MACLYKNGNELLSENEAENRINNDVNSIKESDGISISNGNLIDNVEESIIRESAEKQFGSSDFISSTDDSEKRLLTTNETLFQNAIDNRDTIIDNGKVVNVAEDANYMLQNGQYRNGVNMFDGKSGDYTRAMVIRTMDEALSHEQPEVTYDIAQPNVSPDRLAQVTSFLIDDIGVSVESMDEYLESKRNQGVDPTAIAVADVANKVIALSNSATAEDLTEEAAHMFVQFSKRPIMEVLDQVTDTPEYRQYAPQYREVYGRKLKGAELENQVRLEVAGKILKAALISDNYGEQPQGIYAILKSIWDSFKQLFQGKSTQRLQDVINDIKGDVLNKQADNFYVSSTALDLFYSLPNNQKELLNSTKQGIEKLKEKLEGERNYKGTTDKRTQAKIKDLEQKLAALQYEDAYSELVFFNETEIKQAQLRLANYQRLGLSVSPAEQFNIRNFVENYKELLDKNLSVSVNKIADEKLRSQLKESISKQIVAVNDLNTYYVENATAFTATFVKKMLEQSNATPEVIAYAMNRVDEMTNDINWFSKNVGLLNDMSDPIADAIYKLIVKATAKTDQDFAVAAKSIVIAAQKANLDYSKLQKLYSTGADGKKDGYIIHFYDIGLINSLRDRMVTELNAKYQIPEGKKPEEIISDSAIQIKYNSDLRDIDNQLEERAFNEELYKDKIATMSRDTQGIYTELSVAKFEIYNKYRDANGKIDFDKLTKADMVEIGILQSRQKQLSSKYTENGILKTGNDERIANEITAYQRLVAARFENKEEGDNSEFYRQFEEAKSKGGAEFNKFIAHYGRVTYEDDYYTEFDKLSGKTTYKDLASLSRIQQIAIADQIGIEVKSLSNLASLKAFAKKLLQSDEIGFGDKKQAIDSIASKEELVHLLLMNKKQELIKAYRKPNFTGEIIISSMPDSTLNAIKDIQGILGDFYGSLVENDTEYSDNYVPTDEYTSDLEQATKLGKYTREEFLRNHTEERLVKNPDGTKTYQSQPKFYYRKRVPQKTYSAGVDGRVLMNRVVDGKTYQYFAVIKPNSFFEDKNDMDKYVNPNYIKALQGKTKQYKHSVTLTIDGKAETHNLLNNKYFDTFGIAKGDLLGKATTNIALWDLREALLDKKAISDKRIGQYNSLYFLPQKAKTGADVIFGNGYLKWSSYKAYLKKKFLVDETDADIFGEIDPQAAEDVGSFLHIKKGSAKKTIPRNYLSKRNPEEISDDILDIYLDYYKMAANYHNKGEVANEVEMLKTGFKNRSYIKNGKVVSAETSNLLYLIDKNINHHLYGVSQNNTYSKEIKVPFRDKKLNVSLNKVMNGINGAIRLNKLGFKSYIGVTSLLQGQISGISESVSGSIFGGREWRFGQKEVISGTAGLLNDTGNANKKSILNKHAQFFGVESVEEAINGLTYGRGAKTINELSAPMAMLQFFDAPTRYTAMVATMKGYRLYDGKLLNKGSFMGKMSNEGVSMADATKKWDSLFDKSAYEVITYDEQGNIKTTDRVDNLDDVKTSIYITSKNNIQRLTGSLDAINKPTIMQNPLFAMLSLFKGWFYIVLGQRLRNKQVNFDTGQFEEGNFKTVWNNPTAFFKMLGSLNYYQTQNLSAYEKANLKKVVSDMYMLAAAFSLLVLANLAADDDEDDKWKQYQAFIATRTFGETMSQINLHSEIAQAVLDPLASVRQMYATMSNIDLDTFSGDVASGLDKGKSKAETFVLKTTPLYNIYEQMGSMRKKNLFFRDRLMPLTGGVYEKIKESGK